MVDAILSTSLSSSRSSCCGVFFLSRVNPEENELCRSAKSDPKEGALLKRGLSVASLAPTTVCECRREEEEDL